MQKFIEDETFANELAQRIFWFASTPLPPEPGWAQGVEEGTNLLYFFRYSTAQARCRWPCLSSLGNGDVASLDFLVCTRDVLCDDLIDRALDDCELIGL